MKNIQHRLSFFMLILKIYISLTVNVKFRPIVRYSSLTILFCCIIKENKTSTSISETFFAMRSSKPIRLLKHHCQHSPKLYTDRKFSTLLL